MVVYINQIDYKYYSSLQSKKYFNNSKEGGDDSNEETLLSHTNLVSFSRCIQL